MMTQRGKSHDDTGRISLDDTGRISQTLMISIGYDSPDGIGLCHEVIMQ